MNKIVVVCGVALVSLLTGCGKKKAVEPLDPRPLVSVVSPVEMTFVHSLQVQGTVRAKHTATASAKVPGTVEKLSVREGDHVKAGQELFCIDRINLENAVRAAEDDLLLAKANLVKAEAASEKAVKDSERMERLAAEKAVTADLAEKASVQARSAKATVDAAKAQVTKATTGLAVATKNLADSSARAPFDGVVVSKLKDAGDFVGAGGAVLKLEREGALEVRFDIPQDYWAEAMKPDCRVRFGSLPHSVRPSYVSPSVNPVTRTAEVRIDLADELSLASGMAWSGEIRFDEMKGMGLPASAVSVRNGICTVFMIEGGRLVERQVKSDAAFNGFRSVDLSADAKVVANYLLYENGQEVRVAK